MRRDPIYYSLDRLERTLTEAREELEHIRRLLAISSGEEDYSPVEGEPESGSVR